jgi:hypothetical protein
VQGIVASVGVGDRVTLLTSGTANAISTTFFTLLSGATLLPFDVAKEGVPRMAEWLSREKISIALIAAPLFRRFCASLRDDECFFDVRVLRLTSESVYRTCGAWIRRSTLDLRCSTRIPDICCRR